jgi:hypothetical protein
LQSVSHKRRAPIDERLRQGPSLRLLRRNHLLVLTMHLGTM